MFYLVLFCAVVVQYRVREISPHTLTQLRVFRLHCSIERFQGRHHVLVSSALERSKLHLIFFLTLSNSFARHVPVRVSLCGDSTHTRNLFVCLYQESPTCSLGAIHTLVCEAGELTWNCPVRPCLQMRCAPSTTAGISLGFSPLAVHGALFQISVSCSVFLLYQLLLPILSSSTLILLWSLCII